MDKNIVTAAMIWVGFVVVVAETDWVSRARDYLRGAIAGKSSPQGSGAHSPTLGSAGQSGLGPQGGAGQGAGGGGGGSW